MSGFDQSGVDREFFPEAEQSALLVVNIGSSAGTGPRPRGPRLAYDEIHRSL
ncbi:hypothetical protein ACFY1U_48985 [Streptomyces sp. NPDC001351]|uniref:hypothetical protein n=1 Tax=Streptomyces sp. NPDC001351 TaxID=3364564 RepID=UPI0036ABD501